MSHLLIYVSGRYEVANEWAREHCVRQMSIVCRNIALCGHTPVCPSLMCVGWERDPRIRKKGVEWWLSSVAGPLMAKCDVFCYLPFAGHDDRMENERRLWRKMGKGVAMVPADRIVDWLLRWNAQEILV